MPWGVNGFRKIGDSARKVVRAAVRMTGLAVIFIGLSFGMWLGFRDPLQRARDLIRFEHYWAAFFKRVAALPQRIEPRLRSAGIVDFRQGEFEIQPGIVMTLAPDDFIGRTLLATGKWEDAEWRWIEPLLVPGAVFIDVGAHIGVWTLRAGRAVGLEGMVIAVEPNPLSAARLRTNIASSRLTNVRVYETACSERRGRVKLYPGPQGNTGKASLSQFNVGSMGHEFFDVEVVTLDELIEPLNLTRLDVIKIDTEGAEPMVLRGARRIIERYRPALLVETEPALLHNMNSSLGELEDLLLSLGYAKVKATIDNAM